MAVERTKGIERDGAFSQVSEHVASSQYSLAGSLSASSSQNSMTGGSGCVENSGLELVSLATLAVIIPLLVTQKG